LTGTHGAGDVLGLERAGFTQYERKVLGNVGDYSVEIHLRRCSTDPVVQSHGQREQLNFGRNGMCIEPSGGGWIDPGMSLRISHHNEIYTVERNTWIMSRTAAILYAVISLAVIAFQIALAAGAPWGEYAMGGAFPEQFPPALRMTALVQAALLGGLALVVLARAGLILPGWARASRWLIWLVVAFSGLSLFLNLITPSAGERAIWAPTALLLLVTSALVAFDRTARQPVE
jgi:hypothetical protein